MQSVNWIFKIILKVELVTYVWAQYLGNIFFPSSYQ